MRRIAEAKKAYDTILHFLTKLTPELEQQLVPESSLQSLRENGKSWRGVKGLIPLPRISLCQMP